MNLEQIEQTYIDALSTRSVKTPHFANKSEWSVPSPSVGDKVNVIFSYTAKSNEAIFSDVQCGDTTVVEVKRNGTVVLANNMMFHKNGYGHAKNNNCVMAVKPVHPWNDKTLSDDVRTKLFDRLNQLPCDIYRKNKSD